MIADDFKQEGEGATISQAENDEDRRCRMIEWDIYHKLSNFAFGVADMDGAFVEVQRGDQIAHIVAKTFMNGCEKLEAGPIPEVPEHTPEAAAVQTIERMRSIVSGKGLYWRIPPTLVGRVAAKIRYPGQHVDTTPDADKVEWFVRIRLGIEDVDTWRRPEAQG